LHPPIFSRKAAKAQRKKDEEMIIENLGVFASWREAIA